MCPLSQHWGWGQGQEGFWSYLQTTLAESVRSGFSEETSSHKMRWRVAEGTQRQPLTYPYTDMHDPPPYAHINICTTPTYAHVKYLEKNTACAEHTLFLVIPTKRAKYVLCI